MQTTRRSFLGLLAGGATLVVAPGILRAQDGGTIRIGALNPITGSGGPYGGGMQRMIVAAAEAVPVEPAPAGSGSTGLCKRHWSGPAEPAPARGMRPLFYAQLVVNGIVQGLVVGLAALAITLVFGIARFANAATGDAMTFGAYAALTAHKATGSLLLGSLSAVAATGVLSLAAYLAVFRNLANRSVVALLVASIGVGFVIRAALGVPLSRPIRFGEIAVNPLDLQLAGVAAVALAAVFAVLHLTPIGRQMRAVADDRDLARVSGIRPERVMVALWLFAGGERQQLAFARALMPRPKLMILDEPTAALSPAKVADSFTLIRRLPSLGVTVLVVERRARQSLTISDRGCILDGGRVALADEKAAELYFGRAAHA